MLVLCAACGIPVVFAQSRVPTDAPAAVVGDSPWSWPSTAQPAQPGMAADLAYAASPASAPPAPQTPAPAPAPEPEQAALAPPTPAPVAPPVLADPSDLPPLVEPAAPVVPLAEPAPAAADPEPAPMPGNGVLFRVLPPRTAPGALGDPDDPAPAPSLLLGTIHFGTDAELGVDPTMLGAVVATASTFVGEVDVDAVPDPALDPYRWLPETQPLSSLIDGDAWAMARHLLPDVAPATLERMKPWMVLALVEARGEPLGEASLDVRLQRLASARGLPLVQLETLEDQLRALDCVPPDAQARVLQERLKTPWVLREMSQRALAHYRGRDLDAWLADIDRMPGLGDEARAIEQQARRCLVEDRNVRWMPALLALFASGGCTVAVGAIHLPGKDGLLAALARAGYRIEAQPL